MHYALAVSAVLLAALLAGCVETWLRREDDAE